jgi:hypothetical protein
MKTFLKKISIFTSIVVIVLLVITAANKIILRYYNPFKFNKSKHIVILGDSHTKYAFNDKILTNTCNLSIDADSYFYTYTKLRYVLKGNPQVDTVFISFSGHNIDRCIEDLWLLNKSHLHDRLKLYFPLLNYEDIVFISKNNLSELVSSFFSQILFPIYITTKIEKYGGYQDLDHNILNDELEKLKLRENNKESSFQEANIEKTYLKKAINFCQLYNKTIILINPPLHKSINNNQENLYQFYDKYFSEILFYDFSKIEMKDDYFGDLVHLSPLGSTYLSELIKNENLFNLDNARTHNILYKVRQEVDNSTIKRSLNE